MVRRKITKYFTKADYEAGLCDANGVAIPQELVVKPEDQADLVIQPETTTSGPETDVVLTQDGAELPPKEEE